MNNSVVIKSFHNGLSIYLDPDMPFEELCGQVAMKFRDSAHFFKNAKMAISFEDRALSESEERSLVQVITDNSEVEIICIIGKDSETDKRFVKALQKISAHQELMDNAGQFYYDSLRDGQYIETDHTIIVMGDVYPGCGVISSKDIIIMGGLYGKAHAGYESTDGNAHFVIALEMSPESLYIGEFKYKSEKQSRWPIKPKIQPKIAYEMDNQILTGPVTKELLSKVL